MAKLLVFSHKEIWKSAASPVGWAADGGFVFHMLAIGSLFDQIELIVPEVTRRASGEVIFQDEQLTINPIHFPKGLKGWKRKLYVVFWGIRNFWYLRRKLKEADMVHIPIPSDFGTIGMLLAKWLKRPMFIRYCGNWMVSKTAAERFWKRFMIKHAGKSIVAFATGGGTEPPAKENKQVKWIFSSSLLEKELEILKEKAQQRQSDDHFKVITVSRQVKNKGTDQTLKAIAQLNDERLHFDVVGDGAELPRFKQLAKDLGIEHQVHFHGKLNNAGVLNALLKADLFCFPSLSEGFPKAVMEAMSCGLPVITNPISVLPEMVGETQSGILLKSSTADEIAKHIKSLMDQPEQQKIYAENALNSVKQYSLENWADTIAKELSNTFGIDVKRKRALIKETQLTSS